MKKVKDITIIFLIFFLIYFLQINIFNQFTIFNIKPNLFIILIFSIGIKYDKIFSLLIGMCLGFCLDLLIGNNPGINMIIYGFLGYGTSSFLKNLFSENKLTKILIILCSTILIELIKYFLSVIVLNINIELYNLFFIIIFEAIYNVLIFIIVYPLWKVIMGKNKENENKLIRYL